MINILMSPFQVSKTNEPALDACVLITQSVLISSRNPTVLLPLKVSNRKILCIVNRGIFTTAHAIML